MSRLPTSICDDLYVLKLYIEREGHGSTAPAGAQEIGHAVPKVPRKVPAVFREAILDGDPAGAPRKISDDPYCLAALKEYRSLMFLAQEAHKPMFFLTAADGAIGGHARAVRDCYIDFRALALRIAAEVNVDCAVQ